MAERLSKRERKEALAKRIRDPHTTAAQLIILNKMYDDLGGKTKKPGRPPKVKEPVANEEMIHGRPKSYFSEIDLLVFEIEDEAKARNISVTALLQERRIERERRENRIPISSEQRIKEIEEMQRQADIAPGDTEKITHPDVVPHHLRADIN
jgi:hypothetical protein